MTTTRDPTPAEVEREPTRADLSCLICHKPGPAVDIDHVQEKGMGGSAERDVPENKGPLCRACHEMKTLKRIRTWIEDGAYCWQAVPSKRNPKLGENTIIRTPVEVSERYGCLVPVDSSAAEQVGTRLAPGVRSSTAALPAGADVPDESAAAEGFPDSRGRTSAAAPSAGAAGEGSRVSQAPSAPAGPLTEDWRGLTDDELQAKYDAADQMQGLGFLLKCRVVWTYRDKHKQVWGETWTDQAIERFSVSRRTCEVYANLWPICVSTNAYSDVAPLTDSRSLMRYIGLKAPEDGAVAMEAAVAHHAEFAEPPTVAALAHRLGEEREERERHECPACGAEHTVKET